MIITRIECAASYKAGSGRAYIEVTPARARGSEEQRRHVDFSDGGELVDELT